MTVTSYKLPGRLVTVAILFFIAGLHGVYKEATNLMAGHIYVALDILGFFIGYGILRLRRGWRTCGLTMLWVFIVSLLYLFFWLVAEVVTGKIPASNWFPVVENFIIISAGLFAGFWMIRVLLRSDMRRLFGLEVVDAASYEGSSGKL
jgi:surface polysaccharide O-acyltransferase-like enzyme